MRGAAPILFCCARCSGTLVWARPAAATPAGAGPAASPPPASRSLLGGGALPRLRGGGGPLPWLPSCGGCGGGGVGGAAPPPPRPVGRRPAFRCPRRAPPGYTRAAGVGRGPVGRRQVSAAGGGGEGRGTPPPWFALPSSPGRPLIRPLRLRRPGRRPAAVGRQQAGRVGACPGRVAPAPRPSWKGERCSASRMRTPTTCSPQRPRPLALPPAQPAAATAPAPTQAAAQVTAQTADARKWGGEPAPQTHTPPTVRRDTGARATSHGREGGDNELGGEPAAPQPANG